MALTNNATIAEKMQLFRSHGITRDTRHMTQEADGSWYYQQIELGLNYRMTELQAILGLSQLKRVDEFVAARHKLAKRYNTALQGLPLTLPTQAINSYSSFHLYPILVNNPMQRKPLFDYLRSKSIGVNVHYIPVHTQPDYQALGHRPGDYPQAEAYYSRTMSIPLFPTLTEEQQDYVIHHIRAFFQ